MANFTTSFPGANNGAVATPAEQRALMLSLFSNEVRQVYFANTLMRDKINVKAISGGKEFKFPVIGRTTAAYHTPGTQLTGALIPGSEQVISCDAKLVASVTLDNLEDRLNAFDVRSPYTAACGQALAEAFDRNSFRSVCLAARASHPVTGEAGGSKLLNIDITSGTAAANAKALYEAIKLASETLVIKNRDPRNIETYCVISPTNYYLLLNHLDLLNRDYAGAGSLLTADVPMIANIKIFHSNLFEGGSDITAGSAANYNGKYTVNMTSTLGLVWNKEAVGCVQAMDMAVEASWQHSWLSWLITSTQAHGWGTLIPSNAIELSSAAA